MKRIAALCIVSVRQLKVVHQFAVEPEVNFLFIPPHRPDVKLFRPRVAAEFGNGFLDRKPFGVPVETVAEIGEHVAAVKFHDVHLAARRPANAGLCAEGPERRPAPRPRVNAGAHLELAVFKLAQAARRDAGRGIINPFAAGLPVRAIGDEVRIQLVRRSRLNDEQAVRAKRVFRLIPLQLSVAHKAVFVVPVRRIGRAVRVKFIVPDKFIVTGGAAGGEGRD